jgi:hypothetical protein
MPIPDSKILGPKYAAKNGSLISKANQPPENIKIDKAPK